MKKHLKCLTAAALCLAASLTALTVPVSAADGNWKKDGTGWWYSCADGSYPKDGWKKINGQWYAFDERGYMRTEWVLCKGNWYYLGQNGAMRTGWARADHPRWGRWHYFSEDGVMQTGWLRDQGNWYYLREEGEMEGALLAYDDVVWNGDLYHFDGNGRMMQNESFIWRNYVGTADASGRVTRDIRFTGLTCDCPEGWKLSQGEVDQYLLMDGTGYSIGIYAYILPEETAALSFDAYRDLKLQRKAETQDPNHFKTIESDFITPETSFPEAFVHREHINAIDTPSWRDYYAYSAWIRDGDIELLVSASFAAENKEMFTDVFYQTIRSLRILREGEN